MGLDVHAATIAVAVAEPTGRCGRWGRSQQPEAVRKLIQEARPGGAAAGLLRGRADGLRAVLAADGWGSAARWSPRPWCR